MGLDMYAYAVDSNGEAIEIASWRKHNRLHGWMEELWMSKTEDNSKEFNCEKLEITLEDLDDLEINVNEKVMPETYGFFFGEDSFAWLNDEDKEFEGTDYYYKDRDLEFIKNARKAINEGKTVYYNSWW